MKEIRSKHDLVGRTLAILKFAAAHDGEFYAVDLASYLETTTCTARRWLRTLENYDLISSRVHYLDPEAERPGRRRKIYKSHISLVRRSPNAYDENSSWNESPTRNSPRGIRNRENWLSD